MRNLNVPVTRERTSDYSGRKVFGFVLFICLFGLGLSVLPAVKAQESGSQAQIAGDSPVSGTITADEVNVRGGPGKKYKSIGRVKSGTTVQVYEKQGDWFRIEPPAGTGVWIYGEYVEKEGNSGSVTGTDVNVRPIPRADVSNKPIGQISKPATVEILESRSVEGYSEPWYKIKTPDHLPVWVSAAYLTLSDQLADTDQTSDKGENAGETDDETDVSKEASSPQKGESVQKGEQAVQKGEPSGKGRTGSQQKDVETWKEKFRDIQTSVEDERDKDQLDQDYSDEIERLKQFEKDCPVDALTSRARSLRKELEKAQASIEEALSKRNQQLREIQKQRKRSTLQTLRSVLDTHGFDWVATGRIESVGSVIGRPADFQLVKGKQRLYFLRSTDYDLSKFRRRQVAVSGSVQETESGWDSSVIVVSTIKILE